MTVKDAPVDASEMLPAAVRLATEAPRVRVGDKGIGAGSPVFVIAEIGINHNGSLEIAKRLIDGAVLAGADAVKFQKRTPEKCVPRDQWNIERDTPWGRMTYIDYRRRMEFGRARVRRASTGTARERAHRCGSRRAGTRSRSTSSSRSTPPCYKVASASLTDIPLLEEDARDRTPADAVDRHVDHRGDRRGGRGRRATTTC